MSPRSKHIAKRVGIAVGVVAVLFVTLIGVAHTTWGRPLLAWLGGIGVTGGCPLGLDQVDPAAVESFRQAELAKRDGVEAARSTRALGFTLGTTTRGEADAWAATHGTVCEDARAGSALKCMLGGDLFMQFDGGRLVALDLLRAPTSAEDAATQFASQAEAVTHSAGPPTNGHGAGDGAWLAATPMRHAMREFRYRGFVATVSVTNLGARGVRVREQYQWAAAD